MGDDDSPSLSAPADVPCGKGVLVRSLGTIGGAALTAKRADWLGLEWLAVTCDWQHPSGNKRYNSPEQLAELGHELAKLGIKMHLFSYVIPSGVDRLGTIVSQLVGSIANVAGVMLNAERQWYHRGMDEDAARLVSLMRIAAPGRTIGVTSYGGGPPSHPPFPWEGFSTADYGAPQIYDSRHRLSKAYPGRSLRAWSKLFGQALVPINGASNRHTPEQMLEMAERTGMQWDESFNTPMRALSWWDLYWLVQSAARSEAVRSIEVPCP